MNRQRPEDGGYGVAFREAAEELGVTWEQAVVLEDAIAGVEAGRAAGFGLVVGVDRSGSGPGLLAASADLACDDLRQLLPSL